MAHKATWILGIALLAMSTANAGYGRGSVVLDGFDLDGYSIAVNYLESPPPASIPFSIRNYKVQFQGSWTYYFVAKKTEKDKNRLEPGSSFGPNITVKVDPVSRKVVSAVQD